MVNRFEQVDEIEDDCVSVTLWEQDGRVCAEVTGPIEKRLSEITVAIGGQDGSLSVQQALNEAIKLAGERQTRIVVVDEAGLWNSEWGELFRR